MNAERTSAFHLEPGTVAAARPSRRERDHAYHEAAHAVAMHRLGFGVAHLTIDPIDGLTGRCLANDAPHYGDDHTTPEARASIERWAIVLHAGNAAERHLHPEEPEATATIDHRILHDMLQWIEEDTSVEFAWCCYLWQRAYAFISDPWQWKLVQTLADALLAGPRTLAGPAVTAFLTEAAARLQRTMPDFQLLGEPPVTIRSPWHAPWQSGQTEKPFPRYELEMALALQQEDERRARLRTTHPATAAFVARHERTEQDRALRRAGKPGVEVFSKYAAHVLADYGICGVADLADWSFRCLANHGGIGPKTLREIKEAAARFGVAFAEECRCNACTAEARW